MDGSPSPRSAWQKQLQLSETGVVTPLSGPQVPWICAAQGGGRCCLLLCIHRPETSQALCPDTVLTERKSGNSFLPGIYLLCLAEDTISDLAQNILITKDVYTTLALHLLSTSARVCCGCCSRMGCVFALCSPSVSLSNNHQLRGERVWRR